MTEQKLNQLFDTARNAPLQTSQAEVSEWVHTAVLAGVTAGAAVTGYKLLFTKKVIMLLSTFGVVSVGVITTATILSDDTQPTVNENKPVIYSTENKETFNELNKDTVLPEETLALIEKTNSEEINYTPIREIAERLPENQQKNTIAPKPFEDSAAQPSVGSRHELAQKKDTLPVNKQRYEVPVKSFTELQFDGVFDVVIDQGDQEKVMVESNYPDAIVASNEGKRLILNNAEIEGKCKDRNIYIVVYITVKDLSKIDLRGVSDVTINNLKATNFKFDVSGVGDVKMNASLVNFTLSYSGVGDFSISGSAGEAELNYSGVGDVHAYEFSVHSLNVNSSGVGNMYVYADEKISVLASGIGDVKYKGNPPSTNFIVSGVSTISASK